MTNKEAMMILRGQLRDGLDKTFADMVDKPAYRQLFGEQKMEGQWLSNMAAAASNALVDPTLRPRPQAPRREEAATPTEPVLPVAIDVPLPALPDKPKKK